MNGTKGAGVDAQPDHQACGPATLPAGDCSALASGTRVSSSSTRSSSALVSVKRSTGSSADRLLSAVLVTAAVLGSLPAARCEGSVLACKHSACALVDARPLSGYLQGPFEPRSVGLLQYSNERLHVHKQRISTIYMGIFSTDSFSFVITE